MKIVGGIALILIIIATILAIALTIGNDSIDAVVPDSPNSLKINNSMTNPS